MDKRLSCSRPVSESNTSVSPAKRSSAVRTVAPCRTRNSLVVAIEFYFTINKGRKQKNYNALMHRKMALCLCGFIFFLLAPLTIFGDGLNSTEQKIVEKARQGSPAALELLEKTANINSGTMNHEGVRKVGEIFAQELSAL